MATIGIATLTTQVDLTGLDKGLAQSEQKSKASFGGSSTAGKMAFTAIAAAGVAAMAAATAAVVNFAKESVAEFQQFEQGISEVFTLLPGITADAMDQMEADVLRFGAEVGRTSDTVIPALYQSISAGVPAENVFDFMTVASDAARGGVTDLETAVDALSTAVNAYGVENLSAQEASDLLFTAVKGGKTTFDELGASLFNVIPTAASLGLEFGNVTAAIAAMTAQGTPTAVATTQLRQLLIELSKEGSEAAAVFERMAGKSFVDFLASGGNLQQALQLMEQAAGNAGLRLSDMFGSVEAGAAALTLTGAGTAKFAAELAAAETATGATEEAAATMADTLTFTEEKLAATTEALKVQVGEGLAPATRAWLELRLAIVEATLESIENKKVQDELFSISTTLADELLALAEGHDGLTSAMTGAADATAGASEALAFINTQWGLGADNTEDLEIQSRALTAAIDLLNAGFQGTGRELGEAAIRIALNSDLTRIYTTDIIAQAVAEWEAEAATAAATAAAEKRAAALADSLPINEEMAEKIARQSGEYITLESQIDAANRRTWLNAEANREAAAATDAATAALAAFNESLQQNFLDALNSSEGIGFFNESMEELGEQSAFVSDLSSQQAADLADLQGAYSSAAEKVRDYELGIAGANLTDEERAAKIAEQTALMGTLGPQIDALNAVGGEYISWTQEATVNQDKVNQAIFDAVASTDIGAAGLAIMGGALGLYSEEAVNAALMSALIEEKIASLAPTFDGTAASALAIQEEIFGFVESLSNLGPAAEGAATSVGTATAALSEQDAALAEKLGVFDEQATTASGSATTAFETIAGSAETNMGEAASIVDTKAGEILTSVQTAFGEMAGSAETSNTEMVASFETGMGEVVAATGAGMESAVTTAEGYVVQFGAVGSNITSTMTAELLAGGGALAAAAERIVLDALAAAEAAAEAQSPSRRAIRLAHDITDGLEIGLEEGRAGVIATIQDTMDAVFGVVSDSLSQAGSLGSAAAFFADMLASPIEAALAAIDQQTADLTDRIIDQMGGVLPDMTGDLSALIASAEAAGNVDLADSLREYQALQKERLATEEELAAVQERILAIQEKQQQLAFLQQQLSLIRTLQEAGLDPSAVLEGINLGLDASVDDLLNASEAAMVALIEQADGQLGQAQDVAVSAFEAMTAGSEAALQLFLEMVRSIFGELIEISGGAAGAIAGHGGHIAATLGMAAAAANALGDGINRMGGHIPPGMTLAEAMFGEMGEAGVGNMMDLGQWGQMVEAVQGGSGGGFGPAVAGFGETTTAGGFASTPGLASAGGGPVSMTFYIDARGASPGVGAEIQSALEDFVQNQGQAVSLLARSL